MLNSRQNRLGIDADLPVNPQLDCAAVVRVTGIAVQQVVNARGGGEGLQGQKQKDSRASAKRVPREALAKTDQSIPVHPNNFVEDKAASKRSIRK